jgi:hypothetical protein
VENGEVLPVRAHERAAGGCIAGSALAKLGCEIAPRPSFEGHSCAGELVFGRLF